MIMIEFARMTASIDESMRWSVVDGDDEDLLDLLREFYGPDWRPSRFRYYPYHHIGAGIEAAEDLNGTIKFIDPIEEETEEPLVY